MQAALGSEGVGLRGRWLKLAFQVDLGREIEPLVTNWPGVLRRRGGFSNFGSLLPFLASSTTMHADTC
jgi:hypothetical protein